MGLRGESNYTNKLSINIYKMRANAEKIYKSGKETFLCYCRLGCV